MKISGKSYMEYANESYLSFKLFEVLFFGSLVRFYFLGRLSAGILHPLSTV